MFTCHHGIARQGVITTSYIMSYNVRSVTLASVWVLWRITRNHLLSYLVVMAFFTSCLFFFIIFLYFLSFLSSPRPIHGPTLSRETRKTTRRHDILGQLRTVSKFVSGKTSSSMDFINKNIKSVIISPIKMNQIVFYCYLFLIFLMASNNTWM